MVLACLVLVSRAVAADPPQFGIEASVGQSFGFTSYVDSVPFDAGDTVFLADERAGAGLALGLMLVFESIEIGLNFRWFERRQVTLTHRGNSTLPPGRQRPDGSVDDSGITYESIDAQTLTVPDPSRGSLFTASLEAGYRLYLTDSGALDLFVPFGGGLVLTQIQETQRPVEFGLIANSGFGINVDVARPIGFFLIGRLGLIMTPAYGNQDDINRSAVTTSQSTVEALFSSLLFTSVTAGVQFVVR